MATITENPRTGGFLLSSGNGTISFRNITLAANNGVLTAGTVLGVIPTGAFAATGAAATAGNGDFVAESVSASVGAIAGVYTLVALSATKVNVFDPNGTFIGIHTIGTAWNANGIAFNTSGTWAINDSATITVTIGAGAAYAPYDSDATDGSQTAVAILWDTVDTTGAAVPAVAIVRDAEVAEAELIGIDSAGVAQLAAHKIICL
jgi:hypothetical protein